MGKQYLAEMGFLRDDYEVNASLPFCHSVKVSNESLEKGLPLHLNADWWIFLDFQAICEMHNDASRHICMAKSILIVLNLIRRNDDRHIPFLNHTWKNSCRVHNLGVKENKRLFNSIK